VYDGGGWHLQNVAVYLSKYTSENNFLKHGNLGDRGRIWRNNIKMDLEKHVAGR
jgi:hypothetical protein